MGNYNTWGGKNNRWGNRNRANRNIESGQSSNGNNYETSGLFDALCKLVVTSLVIIGLVTTIPNLIGMAKSGYFDTNNTSNTSNITSKDDTNIKDNTNSLSDLIIDEIKGRVEDKYSIDISNIEIYEYEEIDTEDKFKRVVVDDLVNMDNITMYVLKVNLGLDSKETGEIVDWYESMINKHSNDLSNAGVNQYVAGNVTVSGMQFIVLTFMK